MKMNLPMAPQSRVDGVSCDLVPSALERWNPNLRAASQEEPGTIGIYDVIGQSWDGEGITAKKIAGILRSIGSDKPVVVNVNSPGGDMFEGLAIYNILREHKGEVTVKVMGLAASAASVIAMAGDQIQVARAGFLMIHNSWVVAMGNRHDLREFADVMEPFDRAMADIYSARTGMDPKKVAKMMDAESWIGGSDAVDQGFADALLDSDETTTDPSAKSSTFAARKLDLILARSGLSRTERRELLREYKSTTQNAGGDSTQNAADDGMPRAAFATGDAIQLSSSLKGILS